MIKRLIRRIRLENLVTEYMFAAGERFWNPKERRQARELIKEGPYNPL